MLIFIINVLLEPAAQQSAPYPLRKELAEQQLLHACCDLIELIDNQRGNADRRLHHDTMLP
jgi:hypothetical protein